MRHRRLFRALLGGVGLAGCISLLAGQARADVLPSFAKPALFVPGYPKAVQPELFGTIALPMKVRRYLDGWERARRDASSLPAMQRLIAPARGLNRERQIAFVQQAVHQRIRWMSDATEWGAHDYWASAAETLQHGAGDMEDRAIVKMQALRALGVPQSDLFMTLGRDKVGGPITVLIVRAGKRAFVLDDLGGAPIEAARRVGFEPMLTLGYGVSWIHGRRAAQSGRGSVAVSAAK